MVLYRLRFFFDYGAGTCFWAVNEAARHHFGYAVEVEQLPLAPTVKAAVVHIVSRYDQSLDWNNPGDPSVWGTAEWCQFNVEAHTLFERVCAELGSHFELVDAHADG